MDVEGVPARGAVGPAGADERVAAGHRTEPGHQGVGEPGLQRRERHPPAAEPQDTVDVETGSVVAMGLAADGQGVDAGPHVALGGRDADPVLEAVVQGWRVLAVLDQQQPGVASHARPRPSGVLVGPAKKRHVHRRTSSFGVRPSLLSVRLAPGASIEAKATAGVLRVCFPAMNLCVQQTSGRRGLACQDGCAEGPLPSRPPRGRSSAAEHQLPKLRTRVRFPSPALDKSPGQGRFPMAAAASGSAPTWRRATNGPQRIGLSNDISGLYGHRRVRRGPSWSRPSDS